MDLRALQSRRLLAAATFLAATFVLALQFVSPSPVVVSVGENGTTSTELGRFFTYRDVTIVALAGVVLGASGTFLVTGDEPTAGQQSTLPQETDDTVVGGDRTPSEDLLERRREEWAETADRLANNEQEVYETVLEADGVLPQSDVVERTDLSKATVSRALDGLETKNLVERKRRGMGNVVLLL